MRRQPFRWVWVERIVKGLEFLQMIGHIKWVRRATLGVACSVVLWSGVRLAAGQEAPTTPASGELGVESTSTAAETSKDGGTATDSSKLHRELPGETSGVETGAVDSKKSSVTADNSSKTSSAWVGESLDGAAYNVRLRDLSVRVDELKEQIRRSHSRLSLLSETVLSGGIGGGRAEIVFKNDMSEAFRVTRVLFILDGAIQYNKVDDGDTLDAQKMIPIFDGAIAPGDHSLQILVQLKGHGFGVFSYLKGYEFEVKSKHSFTVPEGKAIHLDATAWEKGGVTTPMEERPALRYSERFLSDSKRSNSAAGSSNQDSSEDK